MNKALMKNLDKALDVQRMLRSRIDLKLFLNRIMTPDQKILFRNQRERIASISKTSSTESDGEINKEKILRTLKNFVPNSSLDKALLQGLYLRHVD